MLEVSCKNNVELRSDHLIAILKYALVQAEGSRIEVLDFGDNENALEIEEQIEYIQQTLHAVCNLRGEQNCDMLLVKIVR